MSKINPFFLIGTIGMLVTSVSHILLAELISPEAAASSFWVLYPICLFLLIIGTVIMSKRKNPLKE